MSTRIVPCPSCGGDKGHAYPVDIDRRDGSLIERWEMCRVCWDDYRQEPTGEVEEEDEPIELEDIENFIMPTKLEETE